VSSSLLLAALLAAGLPVIEHDGVRNAASRLPSGVPGGGVAPGAMVAILGRGFAPAGEARLLLGTAAGEHSLATTAVSPTELRAVLPRDLEPGHLAARVVLEGRASAPVMVRVVPAAFGIFTTDAGGMGPAVAETLRRGQQATLEGTGLAGAAVELFVGGRRARVLSAGPVPGTPGLDRIQFEVPRDAPRGCHVPVFVRLAGRVPSNWATLAIEPAPGACDAASRVRLALAQGGRAGLVVPLRLRMRYQAAAGEPVDFTGDALVAAFREGADRPEAGRLLALPPAGGCTVYRQSLDLAQFSAQLQAGPLAGTRRLEAGTLTIEQDAARSVRPPAAGREVYYGTLGGEMPDTATDAPLFLKPGTARLTSGGAADVGRLEVSVPVPHPIRWRGRNGLDTVDRGRDLTLGWRGAGRGQPVAVAGVQIDRAARAAVAFLCLPEAGATRIRVPSGVLQALPPTRAEPGQSMGFLFLGTLPGEVAPLLDRGGLDALLATGLAVDGRTLRYR
jgi:uncharacterized protein (TIGR03437 family)